MNDAQKQFLISFKKANPNWDLLSYSNVHELPGVKWKLRNISQMDSQKHKSALSKLENVLQEF